MNDATKLRTVWLVVRLNEDGSDDVRYGGDWTETREEAEGLVRTGPSMASPGERYAVRKAVLS